MDMYSRVKRVRRQVKRDMYGIPVNEDADEKSSEEVVDSSSSDEEEEEGGDGEKDDTNDDEGERTGTRKQYYLREHRPRTQIFNAAPTG